MALTVMEAMERIHRGVEALSQWDPDWFKKVEAERVNLRSSLDCPVAQVFNGQYGMGINLMNGRDECDSWMTSAEGAQWAYDHGFDARSTEDHDLLTTLWRTKVASLQKRAQAVTS